jgi:integrase
LLGREFSGQARRYRDRTPTTRARSRLRHSTDQGGDRRIAPNQRSYTRTISPDNWDATGRRGCDSSASERHSEAGQLDHSERPRADQRERRILTSDELERLLAAADDRHRLIFALASGTGARLGEVLGLKWRSVD